MHTLQIVLRYLRLNISYLAHRCNREMYTACCSRGTRKERIFCTIFAVYNVRSNFRYSHSFENYFCHSTETEIEQNGRGSGCDVLCDTAAGIATLIRLSNPGIYGAWHIYFIWVPRFDTKPEDWGFYCVKKLFRGGIKYYRKAMIYCTAVTTQTDTRTSCG